MKSDFETLAIERVDQHVLVVTLNRPEVRNALDTRMGEELRALWSGLYVDQADARCVVLTGAGDRAFCAGADLKERQGMSDAVWQRQHAVFEQALMAMMDCPVPILAAANGAAFGGGLELIAASDFAYAVPGARFALTEVTLGIMPGAAGTQNLPRAVGVRRAKEVVLTGQPFGAEDALAWGLVNRLCADQATLRAEAVATAARIAANAPISVRQAKKALDMATQLDRKSGYMFELEAYNRTVPTADRQEGIRAFAEKRPPRFEGR
jgi:enoyl-CoA hydratase